MTSTSHDMLQTVKRDLHAMMNGTLAQSLRDKGIRYRVIYGVELPRLESYAEQWKSELEHNEERLYALALDLLKTETRECRLLAPMLMPASKLLPEVAEIWVEQTHTQEEAAVCVRYLYANLPYASDKAFQWMAAERETMQLCGFLLIARLLRNGGQPSARDEQEIIDQAAVTLSVPSLTLRKAAYNVLLAISELGLRQQRQVDAILKRFGL